MRFKGFSYNDPNEALIPVAYFDGYNVDERILENVPFKAEINEEGKMIVSFANPNGQYEKGLNQAHWLPMAQRFAEQYDIFNNDISLHGVDVALETDES